MLVVIFIPFPCPSHDTCGRRNTPLRAFQVAPYHWSFRFPAPMPSGKRQHCIYPKIRLPSQNRELEG